MGLQLLYSRGLLCPLVTFPHLGTQRTVHTCLGPAAGATHLCSDHSDSTGQSTGCLAAAQVPPGKFAPSLPILGSLVLYSLGLKGLTPAYFSSSPTAPIKATERRDGADMVLPMRSPAIMRSAAAALDGEVAWLVSESKVSWSGNKGRLWMSL